MTSRFTDTRVAWIAGIAIATTCALLILSIPLYLRSLTDDRVAIRSVIEAAHALRVQDCTYAIRGRVQAHKDALAAYWSDATPSPANVTRRATRWAANNATLSPDQRATNAAEAIAEATAEPMHMPPDHLALVLDTFMGPQPTLEPSPAFDLSPLEETWATIDRCQAEIEAGASSERRLEGSVQGVEFRKVSVFGNRASADAKIHERWQVEDEGGASTRTYDQNFAWTYDLRKERGNWRIDGASVVGAP